LFFFSSRRRHTRSYGDWSSDVCSSDLIAPDLPPLNTDREKLKQIILNLLSNATKFTEQGEIRVAAWREDSSMKITVADTGISMRSEERRVGKESRDRESRYERRISSKK